MASETVRDILERIRAFHRDVAGFYEALGSVAGKERLRLVLEYMRRHEEQAASCITRYEEQEGEAVLGTWYKSAPPTEWRTLCRDMKVDASMSVSDVLNQAHAFQECLAAVYTDLAERAPSAAVRELFAELLVMERTEEHNLVRDTIEMEDL